MQPAATLNTTKRIQGKNTIESYGATLSKFRNYIGKDRKLEGISSEEALSAVKAFGYG